MPKFKPNLNKLESGFGYDGELADVELSWINDNFGNTCLQIHYTPHDENIKERYPEKFSLGKATNWNIEGDQLYSTKEEAGVNKNSNYAHYFKPAIEAAVKGTDYEKLFYDALGEGNLAPIKRFTARLKTVKVVEDDGKVKRRTYTDKETGEEKEADKDKVVIGSIEKITGGSSAAKKSDVDLTDGQVLTEVLLILEENIGKTKPQVMQALLKTPYKSLASKMDWVEENGYVWKSGKLDRK